MKRFKTTGTEKEEKRIITRERKLCSYTDIHDFQGNTHKHKT